MSIRFIYSIVLFQSSVSLLVLTLWSFKYSSMNIISACSLGIFCDLNKFWPHVTKFQGCVPFKETTKSKWTVVLNFAYSSQNMLKWIKCTELVYDSHTVLPFLFVGGRLSLLLYFLFSMSPSALLCFFTSWILWVLPLSSHSYSVSQEASN